MKKNNTFKKINCFDDLVNGVEHWNGNNQHANIYIKIDNNNVQIQHYYRYGKSPKPFTMTKSQFNNWQKDIESQRGL